MTVISTAVGQRRLLDAAQQGDRTAIEKLLRAYEPLVCAVVWGLRRPAGCEREDLAQEARIGLLAAIRAWRPDRGPFPAFAKRCVHNHAMVAVQSAARDKHQLLSRAVPLDSTATGYSAPRNRLDPCLIDTLSAHDGDGDPEARLLAREKLTALLGALPSLTQSERLALAGMLSGQSYQQLAEARGCTRKAASHAAYRARRKLAAELLRAARRSPGPRLRTQPKSD